VGNPPETALPDSSTIGVKEGTVTTITPELRHALEQAGDAPVPITDPETHVAYVIMKQEKEVTT
jgi:hypothetical protein